MNTRAKNPSNTLRTEYDQVSPGSNHNEEQGQSVMAPLYSGDLDMIQALVPSSTTGEFKLLFDEDSTEYKEAQARDQAILKETQEQFQLDHDGGGKVNSPIGRFLKMNSKLQQERESTTKQDARSRRKRKSATMSSLRDFTKKARRKKKGSIKIMGWTNEGQQYISNMFNKIKGDEDSNAREKWEIAYKKICQAVKDNVKAEEGEDEDEEVELDLNVLMVEV